jgi:uncharacterized pyridoxal phosphate-containing UPF0001 family protein
MIVQRFNKIKSNIAKTASNDSIKVIAVSKKFDLDHIMPLVEHGHVHFGENKVQEAYDRKITKQQSKKSSRNF